MKRRSFPLMYLAAGLGVGFLCGAIITIARGDLVKVNYDQVVGQVGETTITRSQLAERAIAISGAKVLDGELKHQAYVQEAARRAGVVVSTAEVDQRIEEYRNLLKQYKELADLLGSEHTFNATPHWLLEEQFRTALDAEKMLDVKVSEADIEKCFTEKLNRFYHPPMVKLILIACSNETDARKAWNRLKDGEDPGELSHLYSSAEDLRNAKGDIGWVPESKMSKEVSDAVFGAHDGLGLKPKEFTEVIRYTSEHANAKDFGSTTTTDFLIFYVDGYQPKAEKKIDDPGVHDAVKLVERVLKVAAQEGEWYKKEEKTTDWKRVKDLLDSQAIPVAVAAPAQLGNSMIKRGY